MSAGRSWALRARLLIAALVLAGFAAAAPEAGAVEGHVHLRTITSGPPVENPAKANVLKDACGVAIDSASGNVFVSNYYEHAVYIFAFNAMASKYVFLDHVPVPEPLVPPPGKGINGPCDLALDSSGDLYVNNWHSDVLRFPHVAGTEFADPVVIDSSDATGVAVDPASDHVLVNDRTSVAEYEAAPTEGAIPLQRIGLGAIGDGYGVAVAGFAGAPGFPSTAGRVYVGDAADGTVKAFDPSVSLTTPAQTIDGAGTPQAGFNQIADTDIAVDSRDGHIYVADNLQPGFEHPEAVVHEFSSLGHYRGPVPSNVAAGRPSELIAADPTSIAISATGEVFVTSGNYYKDNTIHQDSQVRIYGPGAIVSTRILTATRSGAGSGTVFSSDPAGLRCGTACEGEFNLERTVILVAEPAPHSRFAGWTGCPNLLPGGRCAVTMNADVAVDAEFEPVPQRALTVALDGAGQGSVASSPAGIVCGGTCLADFDEGAQVTLIATPASGSALVGWSGCDALPTPGTCTVTMSAARGVVAVFEPLPPAVPAIPPAPPRRTLSVSAAGIGTAAGTVTSEPGGISCGNSCAAVYGDGTTVTLVANPDPSSTFAGWGGCDASAGNRCTVTLGADKTVVAAFGPGSPGPLRIRGLSVRGDTALLRVAVPAPGELSAAAPRMTPVSTLPISAGVVALRLELNDAGRRALARAKRHRLPVPVALTLAPFDGGTPVQAKRKIVFGTTASKARGGGKRGNSTKGRR